MLKEKLDKIGTEYYYDKALSPVEVPDYVGMMDGGFLLRDNLILNIVSSPTKISEYIAAGAALICTPYAGDYLPLTEGHNNCFVLEDYTENSLVSLIKWLWQYKKQKPHDTMYLREFTFENQFKNSGILRL